MIGAVFFQRRLRLGLFCAYCLSILMTSGVHAQSQTRATSQRVAVADAWMLHLAHDEARSFGRTRLLGSLAFGAASVAWGIGMAINRDTRGVVSPGAGIVLAATLSVGLTVANLAVEDPRAVATLHGLGAAAEFAMGSAALTLLTHDECGRQCGLVLSSDTLAAFGSALVGLLIQVAYPPVFVSEHYASYARLPRTEQRFDYALDLLQRREAQKRRAGQISLVYAIALGLAYGLAATQAQDLGDQLILGLSGAALAISEAVTFVMNASETPPSERLLASSSP